MGGGEGRQSIGSPSEQTDGFSTDIFDTCVGWRFLTKTLMFLFLLFFPGMYGRLFSGELVEKHGFQCADKSEHWKFWIRTVCRQNKAINPTVHLLCWCLGNIYFDYTTMVKSVVPAKLRSACKRFRCRPTNIYSAIHSWLLWSVCTELFVCSA